MNDCIFCKIIAGEIPSETVYEDAEFKAILDAFPANKGHVLVLPKTHFKNAFDIDDELAGRAFSLATKIAKAMQCLDFMEGLNVLQNNNEVAGQTVYHFHIHLVPRFKGDTVSAGWKPGSYDDGEAARIREKIAEQLK